MRSSMMMKAVEETVVKERPSDERGGECSEGVPRALSAGFERRDRPKRVGQGRGPRLATRKGHPRALRRLLPQNSRVGSPL